MRKMLHLRVVAGTGGGPEKTILNSPRYIKHHGYDALVAYLCPPEAQLQSSLLSKAQQSECPLIIVDDHGLRDFSIIGKLLRICKQKNIGLLQTHDYKSNAVGLILRRFHKMHLVTMLHGWTDMSGRMPIYKRVDQLCLPWYEKLICVSADLVADCQRLRIPSHKTHLVHNAIETDRFRREMNVRSAKEVLGANKEIPLIGMVCRLSPEKGIIEAISMVDRFRSQGQQVHLWIAGEGAFRQRIEKEIESLHLWDSVKLLGQLPDTRLFYQAMDLFLLNSIREGLPNVVLEAMAFQVPVVATNIAGVPSLIKDSSTGWLIEPDDSIALDFAVKDALGSEKSESIAVNARKLIEDHFSFSERMRKIANIYDSLPWQS